MMNPPWYQLALAGMIGAAAVVTITGFTIRNGRQDARDAVYREAVKAGAAVRVVDADGNWAIKWIGGAK